MSFVQRLDCSSVVHILKGSLIVLTIKRDNCDFPYSAWIQTPPGDPLAIGLRARSVETLNTTLGTEGVLGLVGVEGVAGQGVLALNGEERGAW